LKNCELLLAIKKSRTLKKYFFLSKARLFPSGSKLSEFLKAKLWIDKSAKKRYFKISLAPHFMSFLFR